MVKIATLNFESLLSYDFLNRVMSNDMTTLNDQKVFVCQFSKIHNSGSNNPIDLKFLLVILLDYPNKVYIVLSFNIIYFYFYLDRKYALFLMIFDHFLSFFDQNAKAI